MSFRRRIVLLWRLLKLGPYLDHLELALPTLSSLQDAVPKVEALESLSPRIDALESLVGRIESLLAVIPKVDYFLTLLPRLEAMEGAIPRLNGQIEALNEILGRLENLDSGMPTPDTLHRMVERFQGLDEAVAKIEQLGPTPKPVTITVEKNGSKPVATINQEELAKQHDWSRLHLLSRFVQASEKAREIEAKWQRIQQDEHDAHFAFQVIKGKSDSKDVYVYKKGISDGIRWVLDNFSEDKQ